LNEWARNWVIMLLCATAAACVTTLPKALYQKQVYQETKGIDYARLKQIYAAERAREAQAAEDAAREQALAAQSVQSKSAEKEVDRSRYSEAGKRRRCPLRTDCLIIVPVNANYTAKKLLYLVPWKRGPNDHAWGPTYDGSENAVAQSNGPVTLADELQTDIDREVAALRHASIAFNTPDKIRIFDPVELTVLLSFERSQTDLRKQLDTSGTTQAASIKAGPEMEATLIGSSGLTVTPLSNPMQGVGSHDVATWKWRVEGTSGGAHSLTLSMSAVFGRAPGMPRHSIITFTRKLNVEVSAPERMREFVAGNWQWLWTVLVVPLAGYLWKRLKSVNASAPTAPNRPWKRAARQRI
jgi:hypothetical protein